MADADALKAVPPPTLYGRACGRGAGGGTAVGPVRRFSCVGKALYLEILYSGIEPRDRGEWGNDGDEQKAKERGNRRQR